MVSDDALAILNALSEPALLLDPQGVILGANRAARRLLGNQLMGLPLADLITSPPDAFEQYLRRCSATSGALPGALSARRSDGTDLRLRAYGARLAAFPSARPVVMLRLLPADTDAFSVLARKIRDLNLEISRHRQTQAALEEALHQNETLLRELQHRVKNNMQMLLGLFAAAQRETDYEEVRDFLEDVAHRLMAVVTAQQLMYRSHHLHAIEAAAFVRDLCGAIGKTLPRQVRMEVTAFDGLLPNDVVFPLALILNELLTNAHKHGWQNADSRIQVDLQRNGADCTLIVQDDGPGIPPQAKERRSSGLGLVRGLCRQIGGSFTIENAGGTRCLVRFSAAGGVNPEKG
ncbi:sensor histidine kinase [Rhodoligotrophos defluvii]|uniref:sensor histidine kinase n=1 Tax=Rhodoligotrophos defluvii TaxID=2561934 RepID=UPI0010C9E297|nr:histidine kinase dimerization/phosphoacceptor domain -containing protein [Rhodoligotrophos defluvii]